MDSHVRLNMADFGNLTPAVYGLKLIIINVLSVFRNDFLLRAKYRQFTEETLIRKYISAAKIQDSCINARSFHTKTASHC